MSSKDEDEDFNSDTHDAASRAGNSVAESINENGEVNLYGMKFSIGRTWAPIARGFAEYLGNEITDKLGKGAFTTVWCNSDRLRCPKHKAFAVARAMEYIFRLGPQLIDVGLDLKRTVTDRYDEIDHVSKSVDVYLAANHNMSVGKQPFMMDDNPMIANVRNHMMEKGKNGLWKAFAKFVGKTPSLLLGYWNSKIFEIENVRRFEDALTHIPEQHRGEIQARLDSLKNMSVEADGSKANHGSKIQEIMAKYETYKEEQLQRGHQPNEVEFVMKNIGFSEASGLLTDVGGWSDTVKMMARPKNLTDLSLNKALFGKAGPFLGPIAADWVHSKFANKVVGRTEELTLFKLTSLAQQAKSGDLPRHHELKEIIEDAFRSHAKECGHKQPIKGEKLEMISDKLAEAITKGGLNPYALIDLIGKNKLIHFKDGAYHFASREETDQLILAEEKKYLPRVNLKQYYKEAPFKKEDIKSVYDRLDDDLKALFIACVPVNVLEDVGVKPKEIDHVMRKMEGKFEGMASDVLRRVAEMDKEELAALGVAGKTADQVRSLAEEFADSQRYGGNEVEQFLRDNKNKIQVVLRNITMAEKGVEAISSLTDAGEESSKDEECASKDLSNLSDSLDDEDRRSRDKPHKRGSSTEERIRDIKARGKRTHQSHREAVETDRDSPVLRK